MPLPTVGDVILDRFKLTAVLGQGGMGVVFAAHDRTMDQTVALKFLLIDFAKDAEAVARFRREAQAGRRLTNRHVALIYEVGTVDDCSFMAMEYLRGKDLAAMLEERGPLPVAEVVDYLLQACEAINEAHTVDIVHRDLKPANLFVTTASDGLPLVKVLDFGISKRVSPENVSTTTSTGMLGSPLYMSPEQLTAPQSVDARTDIWSLGVVLYELLAGEPPFGGETIVAVTASIFQGELKALSTIRADVPPGIDQIIVDALTVKRDARLPSVQAFAERLAPFGTDQARTSYAAIERLAAHARAQGGEAVVDSSAAPAIRRGGATAPGPTGGTVKPPSPAASVSPSRRRSRTIPLVIGAAAVTALTALGWRAQHQPSPANAAPSDTAAAPASVGAGDARVDASDPGGDARVDASDAGAPARTDASSAVVVARADTSATSPAKSSACTKGATAACEAACAAHQPGSCHALAFALESGAGAAKNPERAASLYKADCDSGAMDSCNRLGVLNATGQGVPKDLAKARALYKSACDQKLAAACLNLGAMLFDGDGVPKDEEQGANLFDRACELGEAYGCLNVSVAYHDGRGYPKKPDAAFDLADRACKGGAPEGCVRTATAKLVGDGTAKDTAKGVGELDALCARGKAVGCTTLMALYSKGVGADLPADSRLSRSYAAKGCALHDPKSCAASKALETLVTTGTSPAEANGQLQAACDRNDFAACDSLAVNYFDGNGAGVDVPKATALSQKACGGNVQAACRRLAKMGMGARPNPSTR